MNILVNGTPRDVGDGHTLAHLVAELSLGGKRVAVEINQEIVPRSQYAERALRDGDRVEIVTAIGGG